MAEAVVKTKQVPVTTYVDEDTVILTLTRDEAEALRAVVFRVGGKMTGTRGKLSNISYALASATVAVPDAPASGNIYFED